MQQKCTCANATSERIRLRVLNKDRKKTQKEKINLSLETYFESIGQYNLNLNTGFKLKKNILFTSLGRHYFDGWSSDDKVMLFPQFVYADSTRFQQWKPKEQWFVKTNYVYHTNTNLVLKPYIDFFKETVLNKGFPQGAFLDYAFDDYYLTHRLNKGIVIKGPFFNRNIDIVLSHNKYKRIKNQYYTDLTNLSQFITNNSDTTVIDVINHRVTCSNIQKMKPIEAPKLQTK